MPVDATAVTNTVKELVVEVNKVPPKLHTPAYLAIKADADKLQNIVQAGSALPGDPSTGGHTGVYKVAQQLYSKLKGLTRDASDANVELKRGLASVNQVTEELMVLSSVQEDAITLLVQELIGLRKSAEKTMAQSPFYTRLNHYSDKIDDMVLILHPPTNPETGEIIGDTSTLRPNSRDWLEERLMEVHKAEVTLNDNVEKLQAEVSKAEKIMAGSEFFDKLKEVCKRLQDELQKVHKLSELPTVHRGARGAHGSHGSHGSHGMHAAARRSGGGHIPVNATPEQIKHDQKWEAIAAACAVVVAYLASTFFPMVHRSLEPLGWAAAGCVLLVTFGTMLVPMKLIKSALALRDDESKGIMGSVLRHMVGVNAHPHLPYSLDPHTLTNETHLGKGSHLQNADGTLKHMVMPSREERARLFRRMDTDGNGVLTHAEVEKSIQQLWGSKLRSREVLLRSFDAADHSLDGTIGRTQFRLLLQYVIFFNQNWDLFAQIDLDHDERVVWEEFVRGLDVLGIRMTEAEQKQVFMGLDEDNGFVRFGEFCSWAARRCVADGLLDAPTNVPVGAEGHVGGITLQPMPYNSPGAITGASMSHGSPSPRLHSNHSGMRSPMNVTAPSLLQSPSPNTTASYTGPTGALLLPSEEQRGRLFRQMDQTGNGLVPVDVVQAQVGRMWPQLDHTQSLKWALQAADVNHDGMIGRTEFKLLLQYLVFFHTLADKFAEIDIDHDQFLNYHEFKRGCDILGLNVNDVEAQRIFVSLEEDQGDQHITFAEFAAWSARRALHLGLIGKEPMQPREHWDGSRPDNAGGIYTGANGTTGARSPTGMHRRHPTVSASNQAAFQKVTEILARTFRDNNVDAVTAFKAFDKDGDNTVDKAEFRQAIKALHLQGQITERDIDATLAMLDTDGDGTIDYMEFTKYFRTDKLAGMQPERGPRA